MAPSGEPLAIVGMSCRFPAGADDTDAFWDLLARGEDAAVEVPEDRWALRRYYHPDPAVPGATPVTRGGFLRGPIDRFDAEFFGISPREAGRLDPQQRLLLELTWEAFEDGGLVPERLAGTNTGVFVGGFLLDSQQLQLAEENRHLIDTHTSTGTTFTLLGARLAWTFDLRGPCVSMDTACSSSLVALHYACTSIWAGDCTASVVAGVNLMFSPHVFLSVSKAGLLAPDGRCKAFDERADGYARGEGAGVVVLKPLSVATRDGDPIHAVIRSTAVNQDGRTQAGVTVPSREAQEAALRAACERAGIRARDVTYVEAHGTGTAVGDPTEAGALGAVLGADRPPGSECVLGAVKGNLGHLEGAAGMAGLIKTALCLERGQIPPNVYTSRPNPAIPFGELGLRLPASVEPWPEREGPRLAGVNSFGYGGTNGHAILEAPPPRAPDPSRGEVIPERPLLLPLSARSDAALRDLGQAYLTRLGEGRLGADGSLAARRDLGYSASVRRAHHEKRVALVASTSDELHHQLSSFLAGETPHGVSAGTAAAEPPKLAWIFTGMGPQWHAMGRELLQKEAAFARAVEACDALFAQIAPWSLLEELTADESSSRMGSTEIAQAANFAVQVGLAELLRSFGVGPDVVVGHSVGEVAAAWFSGALTLEEAVRVSYHRGRLQQKVAGKGGMLAVALDHDEAAALVAHRPSQVSIAAINGPASITLAGELDALEEISTHLNAKNIFNRRLRVEVPFHSPAMEAIRDELAESLEGLAPRPPQTPLVSTVTGRMVAGPELDAAYWWHNVRDAVLFRDAAWQLVDAGCEAFMELGPHPVLSTSVSECLEARGVAGESIPTLYRGRPEQHTLLSGVGRLYVRGFSIDWSRIYRRGQFISLPRYPWQRQRHFTESRPSRDRRLPPRTSPVLGARLPAPAPSWEAELSSASLEYLRDHRLEEAILFPGAGYVAAAAAAIHELHDTTACVVEDVELHRALVIPEREAPILRVSCDPRGDEIRVHSAPTPERQEWALHATARARPRRGALSAPVSEPVSALAERLGNLADGDAVYARLAARGYEYGPRFRGVVRQWRRGGETLSEIALPEGAGEDDPYVVHPSLLDACLHASLTAQCEPDEDAAFDLYLPVGLTRVECARPPGRRAFSHAQIARRDDEHAVADLRVVDEEGNLLLDIAGVTLRRMARTRAAARALPPGYQFVWEQAARESSASRTGSALVIGQEVGFAAELVGALGSRDRRAELCPRADLCRAELEARLAAGDVADVVYVAGGDLARPQPLAAGEVSPAEAAEGEVGSFLRVVSALSSVTSTTHPRLWVITRGAHAVTEREESVAPRDTSLWTVARTLLTEQPAFRVTCVDLCPASTEGDASAALAAEEITAGARENEIAFRGQARFVHRMVPVSVADLPPPIELRPAADTAFVVEGGTASQPTLREAEPARPGAGDVSIAARAVAVAATEDGPRARCAVGSVIDVGDGVDAFAPGDEVVVARPGLVGSACVVPARQVASFPSSLDPVEAASLGACASAYEAVVELGGAGSGDAVVLHALAPSAEAACIRVIRAIGARAVVVAAEPRGILFEPDVSLVDGRSVGLDRAVAEATEGGAAVVVSPVARANVARELSWLRPRGAWVGLSAGGDDLPPVDLGRLAERALRVTVLDEGAAARAGGREGQRLSACADLLAERGIRPPPLHAHSVGDLELALARAKADAGPVVLTLDDREVPVERAAGRNLVRADAAYLVTGGLRGVGLGVARWLAERGARHLILAGRQGPDTPGADDVLAELGGLGVSVTPARLDVSDRDQVRALLAEVRDNQPPLRGVFHAAGQYGSWSPLDRVEASELAQTMSAKAAGAWNLHRETRDDSIEHFVLFSSITSFAGGMGFGAYNASNGFLDGLAHARRREGLPARVVNLGGVSDAGLLHRDADLAGTTEWFGVRSVPIEDLLRGLDALLRSGVTQLGLANYDWPRWAEAHPGFARSPQYAPLLEGGPADEEDRDALERALAAASPEDRPGVLAARLRALVARVLGNRESEIALEVPLKALGLDSLLMTELRTRVDRQLGLDVPFSMLVQGSSIRELAEALVGQASAAEEEDLLSQVDPQVLADELAKL